MFVVKEAGSVNPVISQVFTSAFAQTVLSSMNLSDDQIRQLVSQEISVEPCEPIRKAAQLLKNALSENRKVMICGDYDADGICSTTMMVDLCQRMGLTVGFYIPDRLKEGYGVSEATVIAALDKGYDFFVLVDNGVSTHHVNKRIVDSEAKLLIIDHHVISEPVQADVLIHPDVLPSVYASMCSSGLAYLLIEALGMDNEKMLQLAGVATVGDMMPLWNMNRQLVIRAIESLNQSPILQLASLLDKSSDRYDEGLIAFQIVPKLNVVGRLADRANVNQVVRFLLSELKEEILSVSATIRQLNQLRRQLTSQMYDLSKEQISDEKLLIITHPQFHEGLVGITAGQISKETGKPTIVLAQKEDSFKGSARSSSIDLHQLLSEAKEHLLHFGGHAQAAGLEIGSDQIDDFSRVVTASVNEMLEHTDEEVIEVLHLDPSIIGLKAVEEFERCAPFGQGFERPLVMLKNVRVIRPLSNGNRSFSKWLVSLGSEEAEVVMFSDCDDSLRLASVIDVIATVTISRFSGRSKISLVAQKVSKSHGNV